MVMILSSFVSLSLMDVLVIGNSLLSMLWEFFLLFKKEFSLPKKLKNETDDCIEDR